MPWTTSSGRPVVNRTTLLSFIIEKLKKEEQGCPRQLSPRIGGTRTQQLISTCRTLSLFPIVHAPARGLCRRRHEVGAPSTPSATQTRLLLTKLRPSYCPSSCFTLPSCRAGLDVLLPAPPLQLLLLLLVAYSLPPSCCILATALLNRRASSGRSWAAARSSSVMSAKSIVVMTPSPSMRLPTCSRRLSR